MRYRLRDGLHYCVVGPNVILLDACRNRYSALPRTAGNAFQQIAERGGLTFDDEEVVLQGLISNGLLVVADQTDSALGPVKIAAPSADLLDEPRLSISFRYVALAFFWEARIALELRLWPLSSVLRRSGNRPMPVASVRPECPSRIATLSQAFDHTGFILGRTNRCLVRSLALFSILQISGIAARFVIGVRSQPFAAHAWVEYGGTVLNDDAEQVSRYTPILALA